MSELNPKPPMTPADRRDWRYAELSLLVMGAAVAIAILAALNDDAWSVFMAMWFAVGAAFAMSIFLCRMITRPYRDET